MLLFLMMVPSLTSDGTGGILPRYSVANPFSQSASVHFKQGWPTFFAFSKTVSLRGKINNSSSSKTNIKTIKHLDRRLMTPIPILYVLITTAPIVLPMTRRTSLATSSLSMRPSKESVVLYESDGRVLFDGSGKMT